MHLRACLAGIIFRIMLQPESWTSPLTARISYMTGDSWGLGRDSQLQKGLSPYCQLAESLFGMQIVVRASLL